jgi:signal peptidase II
MQRRFKIFALAFSLTLVIDQLTKWWARDALTFGKPMAVIKDYWEWRLSFNTGSAFSMFQGTAGARWFLSLIGVAATVAILWMLRKAKNEQKWLAISLGLIGGGAIGNVVDRIIFAKVTDFWVIKGDIFKLLSKTREWPAFNIADVALVLGVLFMFLFVGREEKRLRLKDKRDKKNAQKPDQPASKPDEAAAT